VLETIERLRRENASLRKSLTELMGYRAMAYRDPLTGLRNRRYLDERLSEEVHRAQRRSQGGPSILAIDLNSFKQINDTRGHAAGDEVLRWVASFLEATVRSYDLCCRTGGDEFMVILPSTDSDGVNRLARRLRERLCEENRQLLPPIGLSIGSSTWPEGGTTANAMTSAADAAMYLDKRRQRATLPAASVWQQVLQRGEL
jgi:diguanylate cyclase (GGDEF)-like protein